MIAVGRVVLIAGVALLFLLPLLIYFVVQRVVTRPLAELQQFCTVVEQHRDLTLSLATHANDEVGQTIGPVQRLMQTLAAPSASFWSASSTLIRQLANYPLLLRIRPPILARPAMRRATWRSRWKK